MIVYLQALAVLIGSYVIGSIPFGLLIVRFSTGKDIRRVESGRTGGTNAFRAAGAWAGIATAILDALKAACCVWIVRASMPGFPILEALSPAMAVLGHNYSLFLLERNSAGKIRFRGGAGGGPATGGAIGLWAPSALFILPIGLICWLVIGYASLTTLSIAITTLVIFIVRFHLGLAPWQYILYGVLILIMLVVALRPNIQRLLKGTERIVGLRARRSKRNDYSSSLSSSS